MKKRMKKVWKERKNLRRRDYHHWGQVRALWGQTIVEKKDGSLSLLCHITNK